MKNKFLFLALFAASLACTQLAGAAELSIKSGDTLAKQISAQKGKKITVRLTSGEELTGTVKESTPELVQLGELSGKEYFDAIIDVSKVSAILVRTK